MKTYYCRSVLYRVICAVLIVFLLVGQPIYASASAVNDEANLLYLEGILQMIREQYKGDISDDTLIEGAVRGMLNSLDDYTTYYNNEEKETFIDSVTGVFGGIGVSMEISGNHIIVSKVFAGSPAERAGLLQGDKIVSADGVDLVNVAADKAAAIIKGEPGTIVKLGILRAGSSDVKYFDIMREIIKVNPVSFEIRNGVGYIKLEMFNENTDEFISRALAEMDKNNITKIILDLRDNPGGEVNQAVAVARKFVPKGLITTLDYQSSRYTDVEYYSYLEKTKYKLAVLVNSMSASASEIVAGAVQDTGAGVLVGTNTFGKAKFQSLIPILTVDAFTRYKKQTGIAAVNGYDLRYLGIIPEDNDIAGLTKMTLGVYYTPKGRMIDGKGLEPDVIAEDPKPVAGININSIQKLTETAELRFNGQGTDVYNAKKILKLLGYEIKNIDTTLDMDTVKALQAYQKKSGLRVTGNLDGKSQAALNKDLRELIFKYDKQYNEAVNLLNK